MRTQRFGLFSLTGALAAIAGAGAAVYLPRVTREQYPHRELTPQDVERIEAAKAKRARRAAKRSAKP